MKVIHQYHEWMQKPDRKMIEMLELAGRTCYKSENKITDGSASKFIRNIVKVGHETIIEHVGATIRFVTNRGVTHELVRHRLSSFSQECVVGNTKIKTGSGIKTIKELYDKYNGFVPNGKTHIKTLNVKSVNDDNIIVNNKIKDIFLKGIHPVFRVKTSLGYEIICTKEHRFLNNKNSYKKLKEIKIGDMVMVNGKISLLNICDKDLEKLYFKKMLSPIEIAKKINCPYRSVIRRLKIMDIFPPYKNDKNKEKYNKNHTKKSYEKMRESIKLQYKRGRIPWNKGIKEDEHESVKRQADNLRENHNKNGKNEKNSNWKVQRDKLSISGGYAESNRIYDISDKQCEVCKKENAKNRHHINENPKYNNHENIILVCINCHKKIHNGWHIGTKVHEDEIIEIEYVGEEEVYDIEMDSPYHNYIADGFVTHNSTRYVRYNKDNMIFIKPVWWSEWSENEKDIWLSCMKNIEEDYKILLEYGSKAEQAREILPNSLKTEIVMTANLREWRHVLNLRCSTKSHPQIVALLRPVLRDFYNIFPEIFGDLYEKYII